MKLIKKIKQMLCCHEFILDGFCPKCNYKVEPIKVPIHLIAAHDSLRYLQEILVKLETMPQEEFNDRMKELLVEELTTKLQWIVGKTVTPEVFSMISKITVQVLKNHGYLNDIEKEMKTNDNT